MPARVTLKAVNDELARLGYRARLAKGGGYFRFHLGEAAHWLDTTVSVPTVSSYSVDDWIGEFHRLKNLNEQIMGKLPKRKPSKRGRTA